jgi:hypothetical protein
MLEAALLWGGRSSQILKSMQSHISNCCPFVGIRGVIEGLESSFQDLQGQCRTFSRQHLELDSVIGAYTAMQRQSCFVKHAHLLLQHPSATDSLQSEAAEFEKSA